MFVQCFVQIFSLFASLMGMSKDYDLEPRGQSFCPGLMTLALPSRPQPYVLGLKATICTSASRLWPLPQEFGLIYLTSTDFNDCSPALYVKKIMFICHCCLHSLGRRTYMLSRHVIGLVISHKQLS